MSYLKEGLFLRQVPTSGSSHTMKMPWCTPVNWERLDSHLFLVSFFILDILGTPAPFFPRGTLDLPGTLDPPGTLASPDTLDF